MPRVGGASPPAACKIEGNNNNEKGFVKSSRSGNGGGGDHSNSDIVILGTDDDDVSVQRRRSQHQQSRRRRRRQWREGSVDDEAREDDNLQLRRPKGLLGRCFGSKKRAMASVTGMLVSNNELTTYTYDCCVVRETLLRIMFYTEHYKSVHMKCPSVIVDPTTRALLKWWTRISFTLSCSLP